MLYGATACDSFAVLVEIGGDIQHTLMTRRQSLPPKLSFVHIFNYVLIRLPKRHAGLVADEMHRASTVLCVVQLSLVVH
jgi:hypothetical protein